MAFQAAIWNIVFDTDSDVGGGDFQIALGEDVTSDILSDANSYLAALDGTGPMIELRAMTAPGVQDQIFIVPSPGAFALMGLAGFVSRGRRRRA